MTKHTIQYEEVVEQTEEVAVCNGCGTEVEEGIETYTPRNAFPDDDREIHLHQQCEADLLATSEPDSESSNWNRVPNLEVPDTIGVYLTSIKYIAAFAFLPLTFVRVSRFISGQGELKDDAGPVFTFVLMIIWVIFFGAVIL